MQKKKWVSLPLDKDTLMDNVSLIEVLTNIDTGDLSNCETNKQIKKRKQKNSTVFDTKTRKIDKVLSKKMSGASFFFSDTKTSDSAIDKVSNTKTRKIDKVSNTFSSIFCQNNTRSIHTKMKSWTEILHPLPLFIMEPLYELNFLKPTQIQAQAIPQGVLDKKDILGRAETGSGKTLAFGIPVLINIMETIKKKNISSVSALFLLPSRELAKQVFDQLAFFVKYLPINIVCIIGGMSVQKQIRILQKNQPQIVISTPGRLNELTQMTSKDSNFGSDRVVENQLDKNLINFKSLKFLVVDEADRFFEKNALKNFNAVINQIYRQVPNQNQLQTFIFSATLGFNQLCKKKKYLEFGLIRVRPSSYAIIDLTLDNKLSHQGVAPIKNNAILPMDSGIKSNIILPSNLSLSILKCLDNDKELLLFVFLFLTFRRNRTPTKILIFVNSISYVYRLVPLLQILFNSHELLTNKNINTSHKVKSNNQVPIKKNSVDTSTGVGDLKIDTLNHNDTIGVHLLKSKIMDKQRMSTGETHNLCLNSSDRICCQERVTKNKNNQTKSMLQTIHSSQIANVWGIHSEMKQIKRLQTIEKFQTISQHSILVCSDVAARGLDIQDINIVINFQIPRNLDLFIHRAGRTARCQKEGTCLSFATPDDINTVQSYFSSIQNVNIDLITIYNAVDFTKIEYYCILKNHFYLVVEIENLYYTMKKEKKNKMWLQNNCRLTDIDYISNCSFTSSLSDSAKQQSLIHLKNKLKYLSQILKQESKLQFQNVLH